MAFVPYGKKAKKKREPPFLREADEVLIDHIVTGAQFAVGRAPRHCLPMCMLVERLLARALPAFRYSIRLGALNVLSRDERVEGISFDPRGDDGQAPSPGVLPSGAAFHAWLEDGRGELLDPSILLTLHADGYDVDPAGYFLGGGRQFERHALVFIYEELKELKLIGVDESEDFLARAASFVLRGHPLDLGANFFDLTWQESPHT